MKMFLVDCWIPFPDSEYGGLYCVVAKDCNYALSLLEKPEHNHYFQFNNLIQEAVENAQVFELSGDYESGIVKQFMT